MIKLLTLFQLYKLYYKYGLNFNLTKTIILNNIKLYKTIKIIKKFIHNYITKNSNILIIGNTEKINTKKFNIIYFNKKWPNGFLTNWTTMSLKKFNYNINKFPDLIIFINHSKYLNAINESLKLGIPCISINNINTKINVIPFSIILNTNLLFPLTKILTYILN